MEKNAQTQNILYSLALASITLTLVACGNVSSHKKVMGGARTAVSNDNTEDTYQYPGHIGTISGSTVVANLVGTPGAAVTDPVPNPSPYALAGNSKEIHMNSSLAGGDTTTYTPAERLVLNSHAVGSYQGAVHVLTLVDPEVLASADAGLAAKPANNNLSIYNETYRSVATIFSSGSNFLTAQLALSGGSVSDNRAASGGGLMGVADTDLGSDGIVMSSTLYVPYGPGDASSPPVPPTAAPYLRVSGTGSDAAVRRMCAGPLSFPLATWDGSDAKIASQCF